MSKSCDDQDVVSKISRTLDDIGDILALGARVVADVTSFFDGGAVEKLKDDGNRRVVRITDSRKK